MWYMNQRYMMANNMMQQQQQNIQQGVGDNKTDTTNTTTQSNPAPIMPNMPINPQRNVPPIIINLFPGNNNNPNNTSNVPINTSYPINQPQQGFPQGQQPTQFSNLQGIQQSQQSLQPQQPNQQIPPRNITIPPMMNRFPMMHPMMRPMYPNMYMQPQPQQNPTPQPNQNNLKDLLQEAISNFATNQNNNNDESQDITSIQDNTYIFEKEYSLEEENLKQLWSGFITKNKKDRVGVDAFQIRNECSEFFTSEYNLNVSHRTQFEEIMKRPIIGIVAFSPQNETQCDSFNEYINYFSEKQRVGVVNMRSNAILYIVPSGDFSRKFYQNPKKHLLGIFVNSTVEPKSYVDMNNLSLPPPVISLTEKRLHLKKSKEKVETGPEKLGKYLINYRCFRTILKAIG